MRIILIDNYSGYIYGDSADYAGRAFTADDALAIRPDGHAGDPYDFAIAYAEAVGREIGGEPYTYAWGSKADARTTASGYRAYRADTGGSEAVPVVSDGQSRDEIDAVERDCLYLGFITYRPADD